MKKQKSILCLNGLLRVIVTLASCATFAQTMAQTPPQTVDQGSKWNNTTRVQFYSQDQGSQMIPLKWIKALKQTNGEPFMAANLERYGYLPNPASALGLPVGFTTNTGNKTTYIGMTCAACHTRQIDVAGKAYRIDGGPAIVDFQTLLADLDAAVNNVLIDSTAFDQFAAEVLGGSPTNAAKKKLHDDVSAWFAPNHAVINGSLPVDSPWGPSRVDAISMIFNRVTGVDIGPPPTYMIPENIKLADVPTRYPFLWNAWIQDFTQWPGFSDNGNKLLALGRNTGEVLGVFAKFHPVKDKLKLLKVNYVKNNSANFRGLNKLEDLIMKLGPPKWPFALDQTLVAKGALVYKKKDAANENKSCNDCHGITKGAFRSIFHQTWATPILDVGTDSREVNLLSAEVKTGVLEGASIFGLGRLKETDKAISVVGLSVGGSILQSGVEILLGGSKTKEAAVKKGNAEGGGLSQLKNQWRTKAPASTGPFPYEARVMQGIWAAAPYLHNGSVATLSELLTPDTNRVAQFMIGPAYDVDKVGLAVQQTKFSFTLKTTDCTDRNSGNSRCGHNYGTGFSAAEKKALLEYLKSL
jgi:hypothetical protein